MKAQDVAKAGGRDGSRWGQGLFRLADPRITLASVASLLVGTAAASREGPLSWTWLATTVLGIFFLEVAKNASGEIVDFDSGTDLAVLPEDRSPFSGGGRVLVDGLLTRRQIVGVAVVSYALGVAAGMAIVLWRGATSCGWACSGWLVPSSITPRPWPWRTGASESWRWPCATAR